MRRTISLLLALALGLLGCWSSAAADPTVIEPNMELTLSDEVIQGLAKSNPEEEGVDPLTGLPMGDEPYTPIVLVLDDSPEVFPHWGVAEADWIVQVPLRRDGDTRMLAVYGNQYPEQAGGARSARMTMLPVAAMFKSAVAFVGYPPNTEYDIMVSAWLDEWDFNKPIRYFDLMGNRYRERVDFLEAPQNMSAHINEIHQNLVKRNVKFEKRFFRFADEPETRGDDAANIQMHFFGCEETTEESIPSACSFAYTEGTGYLRDSSTGIYSDRNTGEAIPFANVIVLRSKLNWIGYYPYYEDHLRYFGQAEIFMNGKHISGAWYRRGRLARLVLLDEEGNEIALQRGKTFMVIGDQYTVVSYE
ncbi:MAG: DUF3048 domain-containing protein [Clostridia bacterium]|nr:DUF3048 domain-containing protein [Clostridia bacterium]